MTREEIEELKGLASSMGLYADKNPCKRAVILGKAIKALEQESSEDVISRQTAKAKIKSICEKYGLSYEDGERKPSTGGSAYALGHAFDDLPPVTPQQKMGKWIPVSERLPKKREWYLAVFKEKGTCFQLIPRVADYMGENNWRMIDEDAFNPEYLDLLECVAWMPLPQPYKGESEG